MFNDSHDDIEKVREIFKQLQSEDGQRAISEYIESSAFHNELKAIQQKRRKSKYSAFFRYLKENWGTICNTVIAIAALIVAILSYLK